jgi:ubiquitin-activating enzyme E1
MNPAMQVTAHSLKVAAETESTYDDSFWSSLSGVYTALDNVDARLFVDDKCVYHRLPMVDSGTLGTAGNTQVVVPGLTESYGSTRDPPEESIPICTLKNFPFKIEHTIQWARDVFEGDFRQPAEEANRYLSQPDYLAELRKQPNALVPTLRTLRAYLATERPKTFAECIAWARRRFDEEFDHKIRQLLITFPPDARTTEGTAFWSGTKRAPTPITFDAEDPTHMGFVVAAANLHAFNFNLRGTADVAEFRRVLRGYTPAPFEARAVKVATTEAEAKRMAEEAMTDADADAEADQLVASLPAPESMAGLRLSPVEFEKDDDSNHHIAYITACSNLRARNYAIREEDAHQTKFIAGKIIPAIATTTALVTGLVCVEMLKLAQRKPLEAYRNSFVSLATNVFTAMDPIAPETTVTVDGNGKEWRFSLWDKVEVDLGREPTMGEVVEELKQRYNCDLSMLTFGNIILYMDIGVGLKQAMVDRLQMPITKAVEDVTKEPITSNSNYMMFETSLSYENDDGEEVDIEVPAIRVKVK